MEKHIEENLKMSVENVDTYIGTVRAAMTKMRTARNIDELNTMTLHAIENINKLQAVKVKELNDKR